MKKRILYLSNSYPNTVSGVTTAATNLLNWMKNKYNVGIICPNTVTKYQEKIIGGIPHYFLPSYPTLIRPDVRFITPNPFQIQKAYDSFLPDLIHMHDPSPASIVLKDIALRSNLPVLFSHHFTPQMVLGYLPENIKTIAQQKNGLNRSILQLTCRLYEGAAGIIVPTRTVHKTLATLTTIPIQVISNGINLSLYSTHTPNRTLADIPAKPFVLYVGRLDNEKNLEILIHAWQQVVTMIKGYQFVIAGMGNASDKLHVLAASLGLNDSITWTGMIPAHVLPSLYTDPRAKLFVISSPIESQSIVTLSAMAAKLPVVAANAGALPELVADKESGYLCPPGNPDTFARRIVSLLQDDNQARQMGLVGSKIAQAHDSNHVQSEYHNLYETLLFHHHPDSQ